MRSKLLQEVLDETPKDSEIFVRWYAAIVLRVNEIMKEKGLTQKALAEKLDKRPSEIHKWLKGEQNLTLRSIAKLEAELGEPILNIVQPKRLAENKSFSSGSEVFKVHKNPNFVFQTDTVWNISVQQSELANAG